MRLLLGVVLGIFLCGLFPDIPRDTQSWINQIADAVADRTDPTLTQRAEDALTNWRTE